MLGTIQSRSSLARAVAFERAQKLAHEACRGLTKSGVCSRCGEVTPSTVNHHDSYDRPLDVVELCPPCHDARHRELGWGYAGGPDGHQVEGPHWTPPEGTPPCPPLPVIPERDPLEMAMFDASTDATTPPEEIRKAARREVQRERRHVPRDWAGLKIADIADATALRAFCKHHGPAFVRALADEDRAAESALFRLIDRGLAFGVHEPVVRQWLGLDNKLTKKSAEAPESEKQMGILDKATKGRIASPLRVLIYGTDGIGKSSFAANAPSPFFLGAEEGTRNLDVTRLEVSNWAEAMSVLDALATEPHQHKTIVVDTLDWLEKLSHAHVCATRKDNAGNKHETIDEFPYQAGYPLAEKVWRTDFLGRLGRLYAMGLNVVLVAHAHVRKFKNPAGDDYMRYECKLRPEAYAATKEWVDAVLFASFEELAVRDGKGKATGKGVSTGSRLVHTEKRAAYDAKNRYGLPETMPLDWASFAEAAKGADPEKIKAEIVTVLSTIGDGDIRARVTLAVEKAANDAPTLARILNHLNATTKEAA